MIDNLMDGCRVSRSGSELSGQKDQFVIFSKPDPDPGSKPLCHENFTSSLDDFQYVLPFNFPFLDFSVIIFLVNNFWRTFYKLMRLGSGSGIGH